jgi:hypothetical protein
MVGMNKCTFDIIKTLVEDLKCQSPVCEIGSRIYDERFNVGNLFRGKFVGIDMQPGKGVDTVCDIHEFSTPYKFKTVICTSMLEHDSRPTKTISIIKTILDNDGIGIFTIPFNMHVHNYPSDYWRMTADGLKVFLETEFTSVETFALGGKFIPHTVIGVIGVGVCKRTILKLQKKWLSENGKVYHYAKMALPPVIIHLIKWIMYRRFY